MSSSLDALINPEAINKLVADAILQSALGARAAGLVAGMRHTTGVRDA